MATFCADCGKNITNHTGPSHECKQQRAANRASAKRAEHLKTIAEMTQRQACSLWRFGKSGHPYLGGDEVLTAAFDARFKELGGFTPEISKALGF